MIIYNNTKYKGKNRRLRDSIISLQIKYEKDITRSAAKKFASYKSRTRNQLRHQPLSTEYKKDIFVNPCRTRTPTISFVFLSQY